MFCKKQFKANLSQIKKGRKYCSIACMGQAYKGRKFSPEHKRNLSIARKKAGNAWAIGKNHSKETLEKLRETHRKKSLLISGPLNPNWKGGKRGIKTLIRDGWKYKDWKRKVLERDLHTCQLCNLQGTWIEVDHIYPLNKIIADYAIKNLEDAYRCDLLWSIENGRALCANCHKQTITYGGRRAV